MDDQLRIIVLGEEESTFDLIDYELSKLSKPFTSVRANSREAFLRIIQESSPDLILAAGRNPGFSSLMALALAQEVCPGVPFFFLGHITPKEGAAAPGPDRIGGILPTPGSLPRREDADGAPAHQTSLRLLLQASGVIIAFVSPDGCILEFSREAERLTGRRRHEVLGNDVIELFFPKAERKLAADYLHQVANGKSTAGFDLPLRLRDGTEHSYRWHCKSLSDGSGRLSGIIMVGQCLPELKPWECRPQARLARSYCYPVSGRHTLTRRAGSC